MVFIPWDFMLLIKKTTVTKYEIYWTPDTILASYSGSKILIHKIRHHMESSYAKHSRRNTYVHGDFKFYNFLSSSSFFLSFFIFFLFFSFLNVNLFSRRKITR